MQVRLRQRLDDDGYGPQLQARNELRLPAQREVQGKSEEEKRMSKHVSNAEELGRRAVACKHWRWMPGMAVLCISYDQEGFYTSVDRETGKTVIEPFVKGELRTAGPFRMVTEKDLYDGEESLPIIKRISVPDLSDPATLGCLLHLVRKAWGQNAYVQVDKYERNGGRYLFDTQVGIMFPGQTEAEAMIEALEAAP